MPAQADMRIDGNIAKGKADGFRKVASKSTSVSFFLDIFVGLT